MKKGLCLLLTMCLLISCALAEVAGLEDFRAQQETIRQQQEALQLEIWLDEDDVPVQGEIIYDGRRILTMKFENFLIL